MKQNNNNFYELFKSVYKADEKKYIKKWIVRWKYLDIILSKEEHYQLDRVYSYSGDSELISWLDYTTLNEKMDYFSKTKTNALSDLSMENDKRIVKELNLEFKWSDSDYRKFIGKSNATDFQLQNFYTVPKRNEIKIFWTLEQVLDDKQIYGRNKKVLHT